MPSSKDPVINRQKANEWRLKNPDKHREANRLWMQKKRARRGAYANRRLAKSKKERDPIGYMLGHAERRAARLGVLFALAREDLVMPEVCPVFGIAWEFGLGKMGWRNWKAPSLDRIKPRLGYVPGNVAIISSRANHLKNNASISEMRAVLVYMESVGADEEPADQPLISEFFDPPSSQLELALE
jgi:hypothetical protein